MRTDLNRLHLFRMTHIENIEHILQYGITHISSPNANCNYLPIGDNSMIGSRNDFQLPNGKILGQYIPFYFGTRMPMLYVIQKGYNGVKVTPLANIVYCISSVQQIIDNNLPFILTNGHAVDGLTEFFNESDISQIDNIIDLKAIQAKYWREANDLDLKRRKEAEFLIESDLPSSAILGWAVYNEEAKTKLEKMGIDATKIVVKPTYYF